MNLPIKSVPPLHGGVAEASFRLMLDASTGSPLYYVAVSDWIPCNVAMPAVIEGWDDGIDRTDPVLAGNCDEVFVCHWLAWKDGKYYGLWCVEQGGDSCPVGTGITHWQPINYPPYVSREA